MFFRQSTPLKLSDKKSYIPSIDGVQFHPIEVMKKELIASLVGRGEDKSSGSLEGTVSLASSGSPPTGRGLESSTGIDGEGFWGHDADAVARIFPIMKLKC